MLLEPQRPANLRRAYAVSLPWWAEPRIISASGPYFFRISRSFAEISDIAWSQLIRCHFPPASFIGYRRRFSLITCSRPAAPLEQRLPRLMGCSNHGSMLTQTPFCSSPTKPHPTAQLPQIVLCWFSFGASTAAAASCVSGPGKAELTIPAPTPIPAAFRKLRRSMTGFSLSSHEGEALASLALTLRSVIPIPPCYSYV